MLWRWSSREAKPLLITTYSIKICCEMWFMLTRLRCDPTGILRSKGDREMWVMLTRLRCDPSGILQH